ncbi:MULTISPECIES: transporter substrate-binding domain-containing protein [Brucella/Ochrobactrum group]|uniref:Transporter substrate-binding domain-containing protein n=1 Tax=Ochrobactrum teleogrylli TaxID=2479765 RepID=A0ABD5K3S3_9HYPH|nr:MULTISPECIES: transporter substrate-binding domain-containing protein [Brucella]RRD26440.1 ABC transporter substrate-binding protein [Brucellaceae bacterium VT-16-1752]TNV14128.1 transporter substrate-binding domain-containing protein [[Ochrobactrum] teleogrylli]WHS29600.1 transporter substrate-binding domain-containing protein [Brucella sp. NM4]WHT44923.1 transporter substrate-binding domain-containing protein [Ochrobactrum sp. SSR]
MLKKIAAIGLCTLSMLYSGSVLAKDWKAVTVGVEGAFPPFNLTSPGGELQGLDLDVIKEVCKRAELECNIVAQDWDSQIPSLLAGKFDVVLTMGPNPERRKVIDFSDPYVITPNTFLVPADGPLANLPHTGESLSTDTDEGKKAIADLKEALKGKTIGASLSTSQLQFVEQNFGDAVQVRTYKGSEQVKLDLESGRVDGQYDNVVFARDRAEKSNGRLKITGPLLVGGIQATNVCIGLRKEEPELKAKLDNALGEMRADGTLAKMSEKWFSMNLSPKG